MSQSKRRTVLGAILALGLAGAVGAAVSPVDHILAQTHDDAAQATQQGTQPAVAPQTPQVAQAAQLGEAFATVAESVSPAVVSIRIEAVQEMPQMPQMPNGAPFPFHFGVPNDGQPNVVRGGGSGVLIRPDGYILTNNHVVDHARRIDVVLRDGRSFPGHVVGTDPATDIAVVKIDASGLPTARLASSDAARVGQWVVAIGSPFGLDYTVTTGVLSAKGRAGLGANEIEDYLQTDASINPGNSGGPLVNLQGEVLGINTMIIGRGTGIGFAVPSDIARNVSRQIIENGHVRRAWLGVGFQELTPELAGHFGTAQRTGALISNVVPNGPAAHAGIRPGDVITSVGGQPVHEGRDLLRLVLRQRVGEHVQVGVLRNGRHRNVSITLTERPESDDEQPTAPPVELPRHHRDDLGLQLSPMTPRIKQQLHYSGHGAVVVTGVTNGGAAERAGLREGDVIVEADRQPVNQPSRIAQALADGNALLRVERGDGAFYTVLERDDD